MAEDQKRKMEVHIYEGGQANIALDNSHIKTKQINANKADKKDEDKTSIRRKEKHKYNFVLIYAKKNPIKVTIIIVITIFLIMVGVISQIYKNIYSMADYEIFNNSLYQKAIALEIQGKYLESAVVYSELYGNLTNAKDYQLERIEFWKALNYFEQAIFNGEDKYRYEAAKIFEKIANTKHKENEEIKLMSMGCLVIIYKDIDNIDYEDKLVKYCQSIESTISNNKLIDVDNYEINNTLSISCYALAEYYIKQYKKDDFLKYLMQGVSYYHDALKYCKEMMKYENVVFDSKNFEVILLGHLAEYNSLAYILTRDETYLADAEICFDEIIDKVGMDKDLYLYVTSMKRVAAGKIIIAEYNGNDKYLEEAYEILNSLFYYICEDDEQLHGVGYWMIISGMATEDDIKNIKECYSRMIVKLKKSKDIQEYANILNEIVNCFYILAANYQDKDAYDEGYSYLKQLKKEYSSLIEGNSLMYIEKRYKELIID